MGQMSDSQNPLQIMVTKSVKGLIIRLLLCIIAPIGIGIASPHVFDFVGIAKPRWFTPVIVIAAIIIGIISIVMYLIKIYKTVKFEYRTLEQNIANTMSQPPIEYGIYPQQTQYPDQYSQFNNMGMQQGFQQNIGQGYNQFPQGGTIPPSSGSVSAYSSPAQQQQNKTTGCGGCLGKGAAFLLSTLFFGLGAFICIGIVATYTYEAHTCDPCTAIVTSVEKTIVKEYDYDDDEYNNVTKYHTVYEYTYKDVKYEDEVTSVSHYTEGQTLDIYVNPEDPSNSFIQESNTVLMILGGFGVLFLIIYIAIIVRLFKPKKVQTQ